jgi:hypothetical protein
MALSDKQREAIYHVASAGRRRIHPSEGKAVDSTQFFTALGALAGVASLIVGIITLVWQPRRGTQSPSSTPQAYAPARRPPAARPAPNVKRVTVTVWGVVLVLFGLVAIAGRFGLFDGLQFGVGDCTVPTDTPEPPTATIANYTPEATSVTTFPTPCP